MTGYLSWTENTYELQGSTLRLLLTAELEATERHIDIQSTKEDNKATYCLHRLSESCILYLHTVHSSRSTTFLVVFAYNKPQVALNYLISFISRKKYGPSCGKRAWSDHHNRTACGHSDAFPVPPMNPCPFCTG